MAACPACGREACEACLERSVSPAAYACPQCGQTGVVLLDGDPEGSPGEDDPL